MSKAIALFSGGLDSILATLIIRKQGIEVEAVKFRTPFISPNPPHSLCLSNQEINIAQKLGFDINIFHIGHEFIDIVKNPAHGYGKNMNPCIDCRILMLKKARDIMNQTDADFIITGEVLGQRPMSQRKETLYHIDKEAGVTDYVLRPLSAKLLSPTIPELKKIINRDVLYNFNGRSRKPQITLAKKLGLSDYPLPTGGCLLTDPIFAYRLRDLLKHNPDSNIRDFDLLKIGRHFRLSPLCKIIVGRDKAENEILESLAGNEDSLLQVEGYGSPLTLITGQATDEILRVAASICARYSDAKKLSEVEVVIMNGDNTVSLRVSPADNEMIEDLRIGLKSSIIMRQ
ncbi:MAG: hypothetical protein AB1610_00120 [Nitrospirota bacterium]